MSSNATSFEDIHASPFSPPTKQLTQSGQNRQPVVLDENRILYVSRGRKTHKDPQLYMLHLETNKETRLTFQRGHLINGLWMNNNEKLIYASSTDEEKETPQLLKEHLDRFPASLDTHFFFHLFVRPSEIYLSDLFGQHRKRLSKYSGYDAFPAFHEKSGELYFSRLSQNRIGLFKQKLEDNFITKSTHRPKLSKIKSRPVLKTLGHDIGLQLSPSQSEFVWYRFSPDFTSSQLMISEPDFKNPRFLTMDGGVQWSPHWHPDGQSVIYSARKDQDRDYDLYEVSKSGNCQRKIASLPGDEFFPVISSDGQYIFFTSTKSGNEQIHQIPYPQKPTCPEN